MQFKIRTKLLLAFGIVVILMSILNIYGMFKMNDLAYITTKIYVHPLTVTRASLSANINLIKMQVDMKNIISAKNQKILAISHKLLNEHEQEVYQQFNIVKERILGQEGDILIEDTIQIFKAWSPIREKIIGLAKLDKRQQAINLAENERSIKHLQLLEAKMNTLKLYAADKADDMYNNAQNTRNHIIKLNLIALFLVIAISIALSLFISLGISRSVEFINKIAEKMVVGKITETVEDEKSMRAITTNKDEIGDIGRAFYAVATSFKSVIDDIVEVSQQLAKSNLRIVPKANYPGDFMQIREALTIAIPAQRKIVEDVIQISKGLSEGNLAIRPQVVYAGDFIPVKTSLESTFVDLQQVIADIVQVAQALAIGEQCNMHAEYKGDFIQIQDSLEQAASKMAETTSLNKVQDWLKTGQTQFNEAMSGEQNINELAKNIVTFLAKYLDIQVGIFYLLEESKIKQKSLKLIASYAYVHRKGLANEFPIGEGLVGQSALEKKTILITKVPSDYYIHIQSGLGKALPNNVIVQPFTYENTLKGVIELAAFNPITDLQQKFLDQVMPSIGIAINTAESRNRVQALLEQSRQQTEELQTQAEELQTQQEELTQTNEELELRTTDLEQQKEDVRKKNVVLEKTQAEMEKAKVAIEIKAKELELASKYKSEFLANMSHELRTPLNSLLILAQLLKENKGNNLSGKQVEYADTIHSAGSDLLTLINEILDLSKVEAGKIEVNIAKTVLADLLEAIKQKFRHIAKNKQVAFNFKIAKDIPDTLLTDGQRLTQIINNLLSNAFKFTTKGEVCLSIAHATDNSLSQTDNLSVMDFDASKTIAISISDTGIGIPKEKQQVIFEAFQQADGSTSRRFGGTGLGLSISRQLSRLLKGELILTSEAGKGSTFTLFLPIEDIDITVQTPNVNSAVNETQQSIPIENTLPAEVLTPIIAEQHPNTNIVVQTNDTPIIQVPASELNIIDDRQNLKSDDHSILIIEDDRKFSSILLEFAREKGFKSLLAEDGRTGLQLANRYKPTAIILDVGLPQIDGLTVMECLKDNSETRHIPVQFMSASDQDLDVLKMGAIGYLHKPVNMNQLVDTFRKIESFVSTKIRNLLVVVNHDARREKILYLVENSGVKATITMSVNETLDKLESTLFDCIILDLDGFQNEFCINILEFLVKMPNLSKIPVIIYSERDFSESEEICLNQMSNRIPIKPVKSMERLLDETILFLHQVEAKLPENKRKIIRMVHDKEAALKDKTILIVDDDVRNTFALATALEDKGMEVITANDGKKALIALDENEAISMVIMDIMMPEMDGYKTMEKIRQHSKHHKIPIIALTAKAMKGDRQKCIEAGANDYLSKPVDTNKLLSLMRVWLYK